MHKTELTRRIKDEAQALGFEAVGILPAVVLDEEAARLSTWLDKGFHADMDWMAAHREMRANPSLLMPEAKSIVCVAMNYYTPDPDPFPVGSVKIAKYARGKDYHKLIRGRLVQLLKAIQALLPDQEVRGRAVTDSAPLMDRPLAIRAGLGWQGKNGNLIHPRLGSFLFLGELLLNIELESEATQPLTDHCGRCTRCLEACPTDAIPQPGVIDSNRCIAYWTIESDAEQFPADIAANLQSWAFGCDICQDVCPWNQKFAHPTQDPAFAPRPLTVAPVAEALLALDEATFTEAFANSPLQRTGLQNLHRNVRAATLPHPSS